MDTIKDLKQVIDINSPITVNFLKNNFEDCSMIYKVFATTKRQTPISVDVFYVNGKTWKVCIGNNEVNIMTVGQLKMFLIMFGLDNFAKNLKID